MPKIDDSVINYAVYEDGTEHLGMAEVTLPEISNITNEVKGAGLNGTYESVVIGHLEAMTLSLNFRTFTKTAVKLLTPGLHQIDLRAAQQSTDSASRKKIITKVKHVMKIESKKLAPGKVTPASPADASGEYPVSYWAAYIDGKKVLEIDILNFIYFVDGTDYLADVRKALGK